MRSFKDKVIAYVIKIPKGKVASYGQVAAAAGSPRAARQVGGILKAADPRTKLPWWRVINSQGQISIKGNWEVSKELQSALLKREGIKVNKNFQIDINQYRY